MSDARNPKHQRHHQNCSFFLDQLRLDGNSVPPGYSLCPAGVCVCVFMWLQWTGDLRDSCNASDSELGEELSKMVRQIPVLREHESE